jgi:hypothetical protein
VVVEEEDSKPGLIVGSSAVRGKAEMRYELTVGREVVARFVYDQTLIESGLRARIENETKKAAQQKLRPVVPALGHFDMGLATRG